MTLTLTEVPRERPDPYVEWEFRTRLPGEPPLIRWACGQISVPKAPDGTFLTNLRLLKAAVDHQTDEPGPGFDLLMSADEYAALLAAIAACQVSEQGMIRFLFVIYRPEGFLYVNGAYADRPYYQLLYAGPALADFDPTRHAGQMHQPSVPTSNAALSGAKVAVGIIDDAIGFANTRFRTASGSSRLCSLWAQDIESASTSPGPLRVVLGQRFDHAEIDQAIASASSEAAVYCKAGLVNLAKDGPKPLASRLSHGTHVLDLAAGSAPSHPSDRPIFAVTLPTRVTGDTSGATMASYVFQAVRQIIHATDATNRSLPLVINFSYGILAGPQDGTQPAEAAIARLIEDRNRYAPTFLLMPSGNSYRMRTRAEAVLAPGTSQSFGWQTQPDDFTANTLEIWIDGAALSGPAPLTLSVTPPGAAGPLSVTVKEAKVVLAKQDQILALAGYFERHAQTGRCRVTLFLAPSAGFDTPRRTIASGIWQIGLTNVASTALTLAILVQRDDTLSGRREGGRQSFLTHANAYERDPKTGAYDELGPSGPLTYGGTLNALATGKGTFIVGGATRDKPLVASDYASSGPTPGRAGPDVAAYADEGYALTGVMAAGTWSGSRIALQGTSGAAPQVSRRLADYIEAQPPFVTPPDTMTVWNAFVASSLSAGIAVLPPSVSPVAPVDARLGKAVFALAEAQVTPPRRYAP